MSKLTDAIREYIRLSDALLLQGVRCGALSLAEAKLDAAEIDKWRQRLAEMEAPEVPVLLETPILLEAPVQQGELPL